MRISELSSSTGVSIATIKYYLREGLLHPGQSTAANQAVYDHSHAHRLRLVRALREVAGLPVARIAEVLAVIDEPGRSLHEALQAAHHSLGPEVSPDAAAPARAEVDAFVDELGWEVSTDAPGRDLLAVALVALRRLGRDCDARVFAHHAELADELARFELRSVDESPGVASAVEQVVVGTLVFEQAVVALRRLAEEHHSSLRFGRRA